jgi:hypothetical protein
MWALLLSLVLLLPMVIVLGLLCRRVIARGSPRVPRVPSVPLSALAALSPMPTCPEVADLDDTAFRAWLGVLPATYDRYVDTGVEDFEIFLADHPARHAGEDPAEPLA